MIEGNEPSGSNRFPGPDATLSDMLSDPRNIVDGVVPALIFVATNNFVGVRNAAIAAGVWAVGVVSYRVAKKHKLRYAFGGMFGLGLALFFALRSGEASDYFLPGAVMGFGSGVLLLATVPFKPISIAVAQAVQKLPNEFYRERRTLQAHRVVTTTWAVWAFLRNGTKLYLVNEGAEWALAVVHTAAYGVTVALIGLTWAFLRRRAPVPADGPGQPAI